MSSNSCILAFLAVLVFDLLVIVVWLVAKPDRGYLTAREALDEIKQAANLADKFCFFGVFEQVYRKGSFGVCPGFVGRSVCLPGFYLPGGQH